MTDLGLKFIASSSLLQATDVFFFTRAFSTSPKLGTLIVRELSLDTLRVQSRYNQLTEYEIKWQITVSNVFIVSLSLCLSVPLLRGASVS